eukprot:EST45333.1 Calmodulin [Spironucleus salmonicida]
MDELKDDASHLFSSMIGATYGKVAIVDLRDITSQEGKDVERDMYRNLIRLCDPNHTKHLTINQLTRLLYIIRYSDFTNVLTVLFYALDLDLNGYLAMDQVLNCLSQLKFVVNNEEQDLISAIVVNPSQVKVTEFLAIIQELRNF